MFFLVLISDRDCRASDSIIIILSQLNHLEKAVAAAHTFLQKNPDDPSLIKNMNYYKTLFDVEEYLINQEEQPYEVCNWTLTSLCTLHAMQTLLLVVLRRTKHQTVPCVAQSVFLKAVKLYNSGDFSSSTRNMEQALTEFFDIYDLCSAGCEGSYEITEFKDFYPTLAGEYGTFSLNTSPFKAGTAKIISASVLVFCRSLHRGAEM